VNLADGPNGIEAPVAGSPGTSATPTPGPAGTDATARASRAPSTPTPGPDQDKGEGRPVPQAMRDYHRRVAPVLDKALPDRFGTVTAGRLVHAFTVRKGDRSYPITFRVDADPWATEPLKCLGTDAKGDGATSCVERTLPNGWHVVGSHQPTGVQEGSTLPLPQVEMTYRGHRVSLFMFNDERHLERVPISDNEMIDIFADPGFAAAITEWASHPDWTDWGSSESATAAATPTR
jgi:hypothetical protein